MTLLLLNANCAGIVSSRRIERACYEDLAFRVLTANQQPDRSLISGFRRRSLNILDERLWRTVKYEEVYLHAYSDGWEAKVSLARFL